MTHPCTQVTSQCISLFLAAVRQVRLVLLSLPREKVYDSQCRARLQVLWKRGHASPLVWGSSIENQDLHSDLEMERTWGPRRRTRASCGRNIARAIQKKQDKCLQGPVTTIQLVRSLVRDQKWGQGHTPKGLNNRERSLDFVLEAVGTTRSCTAGINCWRKSHSPVPRFYS